MKAKAPKKTSAVRKAKAPARVAAPADKPTEKLIKLIVQALDSKKAEDLRVLDVSKLSSITDYLVLATGTSEPHLRALRIELERVLDDQQARILAVDTTKGSGWTVVDAFEVMVHLFTPENRDKYRMELLWRDAVALPLAKILK
ncbi:ribosome silencing factor [Opitutus sp. GAS368]|uniref:ribosome silencing factor n=1 Tax=Opitutus sp. GAS368 TaxID=1882749 RepID=UPI00087CEF47|nr:ribosome silencing factor [Opitutus sp. GAS368]SDS08947.1 ribosome-associated protein [Opitutus sp. GAS368]